MFTSAIWTSLTVSVFAIKSEDILAYVLRPDVVNVNQNEAGGNDQTIE